MPQFPCVYNRKSAPIPSLYKSNWNDFSGHRSNMVCSFCSQCHKGNKRDFGCRDEGYKLTSKAAVSFIFSITPTEYRKKKHSKEETEPGGSVCP